MSDQPTTAVDYEQLCERGARYAYSILRNLADAEEAVQESLCRLMAQYRSSKPLPQPGAVYFTILRNLCIDQLRYRKRFEPMVSDPIDPRSSIEGLDALQTKVSAAVAALPEPWSAALRLRVDGELSYGEIASVLECTPAQVRTWIYRGRRQLEREFADVLSPEERK